MKLSENALIATINVHAKILRRFEGTKQSVTIRLANGKKTRGRVEKLDSLVNSNPPVLSMVVRIRRSNTIETIPLTLIVSVSGNEQAADMETKCF